jgi:glycosyltransferase involved in cell wall biosynthesis
MKFVFTSYITINSYNDPVAWLERIKAYTGILDTLALSNEVISIEQINYKGDVVKNGVQYRFKQFNRWYRYFPFEQNRYISKLNPDIVFIQSLHFPLQVILLRLALGRKPKIIIQNHAEKPFGGIKKYLLRLSERYVNAYLFASKAMGLDWIANGNLTSPQKIHEVMELSSYFSPIAKNKAKAKTGITTENVFLWVGRLDENKDPLTVIKAFLEFAAVNAGACLYMIYHTEELLPSIKELLNVSSNAGAIKLIGKIPNEDMLYWYNSADFVISGSHYEGSGTAVCEAMSCGCIPVVTDIPSFRMMTDNGNVGMLYEAGNEAKLLRALIRTTTLNKPVEGEKALSYFRSNLSFEAIALQIQEIAASC